MRCLAPVTLLLATVFAFLATLLLAMPASAFTWQKTPGPEGAWVVGLDQAGDNTLWLAARGGGVYSSADGTQWTARNSGLTRFDLADLVLAANGTPIAVTPTALFRFAAGSWTDSSSGIPFATNSNAQAQSLLRTANGTLLLSASALFRSTDDGATWSEASNGMAGTVVLGTRFAQVRLVKQDSAGNLYAATTDPGNRVYVSVDGGANWSKRETGLPAGAPITFAADANGAMLAFMTSGDVYRTTDAGVNWTRRATFFSAVAHGIHSAVVAADGSVLVGQGSNTAITASLRRSTNGGAAWTSVANLNVAGAPLNQQGAAVPVIRAVSGGRLLAGFNGAGVWQSTDGISWAPMNKGLDAGVVNSVFGGPGSLLAAGRGSGNQCTTSGGSTWVTTNYTLQSTDIQQFFKPAGSQRILAANILRDANRPNLYSSTDGGATWSAFATNQQPAITRITEHAGILYSSAIGTSNGGLAFMFSDSGGERWSSIANVNVGNGQDIAADQNGNLFLLSNDGGVYRRLAGQTAVTRIDNVAGNGLPNPAFYGSVIGDGVGNVYLVTTTAPAGPPGVYVSADAGNTWTRRSTGLPQDQINLGLANLRFEKGPNGTIYLLSKQAGLFSTTNGGTSWTDENGNLPIPAADPSARRGLLSLGFAADGTAFVGLEGAGVYVAGALGSGSYTGGVNCAAAAGPDPDLDPSYDGDGVGIIPEPSGDAFDSLVDAQGRLIVLSTNAIVDGVRLARFTAEGTLDTGYGSNGLVSLLTNQRIDRVNKDALALQADGKLVMALSMSVNDIAQCQIVRLNTDGSLDAGFGGSGVVGIPAPLTPQSACAGIDVTSDGDIVVAGEARFSGQSNPFAVWRLNGDGSFDTGFDGDGMFQLPESIGRATNVVADGTAFLVAGETGSGNSQRALLLRLNADGSRDTAFGNGGEIPTGGFDIGLARRADGQFATLVNDVGRVTLYTPAGTRVTRFGTTGFVDQITGLDLAFRSDGSLLVTERGSQNSLGAPQLTLLNPDGSRNTSFGNNGTRVFLDGVTAANRPCANGAGTTGANLDPQGRALIAGQCSNGNVNDSYGLRTRVLPVATSGGGSGADTTPDAFAFAAQTGVAVNAVVTSNTVSISGIDAPTAVMVAGGRYSIGCTQSFTDAAGSITNGQTVCVQHTAAATGAGTVQTVLNVGGVMATFSSTTADNTPTPPPADTTPDAFGFAPRSDTEPGAVVESESVTIRGIDSAAAVTVQGGDYRINGGSYGSAAGTLANGDTVQLRHTASLMFSTTTVTTLSIGGVTGSFTSSTRAQQVPPASDTTPDAFRFMDQTDVMAGATVSSNAITVSGINAPAAISVQGGEYSVDGGAFAAQAGQISNGQTVQLRLVAAAAGQSAQATLTVGGVSDTFDVASAAATSPPPAGGSTVQLMDAGNRPIVFTTTMGTLVNVRLVPTPAGAPANVRFTSGVFAFDVEGVTPGAAVTVTVQLPPGSNPNSYYKFGTEPGIAFDHYYRFNFDAATGTGAQISGDTVALQLRDNGRGDHDPVAGRIRDPGGPVIETDAVTLTTGGGSLGLLGLLPLLAALACRRRRQGETA
ncbi:MAG: choice-of-anchor U domain-containing protein [Stagnimonas sp.]|nr:choice-of-anchor U domain-containing protein [Stagnimonas sp.]